MPKRQLPSAGDRLKGRVPLGFSVSELPGCIQRLPTNPNGRGRRRKDCILHKQRHPLWLKNAGATYQQVIDKAFQDRIERNIEAYVDDIITKSKTEEQMILDIIETFDSLRKINMKLNPSKCSFGMEEGRFLGFTITPRGIKANPKKIQAIENMQSPRSKRYTDEAEKAFQDVKAFLKELPTLTAPIPGETLTVYLAASSEAISSVLIADRGKTHMLVYLVSKVLQNGEVNYLAMEKLIYALVHTARQLRRYFQAHPIQVFTNQPIKHVLTRPENSERMAKWEIELGEHEITFLPRHSVKGQVIADFQVELSSDMIKQGETTITKRETDEFWELYTDGASSEEGAGIGLLLVSPNGEEITYAIRLKIASSTNEAEYEALIAGLRLAKSIDVRQLTAYVDSQLVESQLNGSFEARDTSMQKYLELTKALNKTFAAFEIKQIPRNLNKKADALSKLASLLYDHFTKKVMVEVLERKSTEEDTLMATITIEEECWIKPFIKYLVDGTLPEDKQQARRIQMRAPMYNFKNGILYRKSFIEPYLRCVGPAQAKEIIQEMHE
ncbi:uncharacterized protein [Rutidosis leptorrhynchoides]|uniref:uncharacterized protein n=1 Tax=Rutidosis leptorrhynchoides TaxID=125765 RepID=UPI003A99E890